MDDLTNRIRKGSATVFNIFLVDEAKHEDETTNENSNGEMR